jgi:hypothetical protein
MLSFREVAKRFKSAVPHLTSFERAQDTVAGGWSYPVINSGKTISSIMLSNFTVQWLECCRLSQLSVADTTLLNKLTSNTILKKQRLFNPLGAKLF